jgi:SAM-dependent methyltransferase
MRKAAAFTHFIQYAIEWGHTEPVPGWFDHYIDQYYAWQKSNNPLMWERGVFGLLSMKAGARVLELCCGDGFNSHLFYSIRAGNVVAVDLDPDAIRTARRIHSAPNVSYAVADIRTQLPEGPFDNIVWDASLEYFTAEELAQLLSNIKSRLRVDGVFSGCAMVKDVLSAQHRHLLRTKNDLAMLLKPHFKNVRVFETIYPNRHNVYFFAGEGLLPFDDEWPQQLVER